MNEKIGTVIRAHRRMQGLRQVDLAEKTGVSDSLISYIEQGRRSISLELLGQIADILGGDVQVAFQVRKDAQGE